MNNENCSILLDSFHKNLSRRFGLRECHINLIYYTVMIDNHRDVLCALNISSSYYYKLFDSIKVLLNFPPFSRASDLTFFYFTELSLFTFENIFYPLFISFSFRNTH